MSDQQKTIDHLVDIVGDLKDEIASLKETVAKHQRELAVLGIMEPKPKHLSPLETTDKEGGTKWTPCSREEEELYALRTELH